MTRDEWLKTLKSAPGTPQYYEENSDRLTPEEKLAKRLLEDTEKRGKPPAIAYGAYGPEEDKKSDAYVERIEFPKEGGSYMTFYGCPFKSKGLSPTDTVKAMQTPKYLFSNFLVHILDNSKLLALSIGIAWLLNRNGFLKLFKTYLEEVVELRTIKNSTNVRYLIPYLESVGWGGVAVMKRTVTEATNKGKVIYWPEEWYNECETEIHRCLIESSKGEGIWEDIFKILASFFRLFLYIDNTYRSRAQDALSAGRDVFGTLEIILERERGQRKKYKVIKVALHILLFTSPTLKRIVTKFFKNLDRGKVRMDVNDWYFACTYQSYDFRGLPLKERRKFREQMNVEYQVVFM